MEPTGDTESEGEGNRLTWDAVRNGVLTRLGCLNRQVLLTDFQGSGFSWVTWEAVYNWIVAFVKF